MNDQFCIACGFPFRTPATSLASSPAAPNLASSWIVPFLALNFFTLPSLSAKDSTELDEWVVLCFVHLFIKLR